MFSILRFEDEKEKEMARIKEEIGVFARWKEEQRRKGLSSGVVEWGDYKNSPQFSKDRDDHRDRVIDKQECSVCGPT